MIFDPRDLRDVRLVATIGDGRDAKNAAVNYDREREQYENAMREKHYGSLMRQSYGVCG